jgi:UDP-glucose 4-epimerase
MKKILVTGGAGFIGSHTVVALHNAGYEAVIVDDFSNSEKFILDRLLQITGKSFKCYEADCADEVAMEKVFKEEKSFAGVIHFAAYKSVPESVADPLKYYSKNIGSLCVVLKLMKQYNVNNLIFSSSCTVYGQPDQYPVTEETPQKPANSPYGNTKKICEDILRDFVAVDDLKTIALRYFNPIGAHPSGLIGELPKGVPTNLIPFITQTAIGIRGQLTVFGDDYNTPDGTNVRDFIDVNDLAQAHVKAIEYLSSLQDAKLFDTLNVGTGNGVTVLQVVKAFEKVNDLKLNYKIGPRRSGDVEAIYATVDKAEQKLKWSCVVPLEDSLKHAWNWEKALAVKK